MRVLRAIMRTYLHASFGFRKLTGTGAFGERGGEYVEPPLRIEGNPIKQALWRHHVKQYHEASCSVATVASVVNAILSEGKRGHVPIGQLELLETVKTGNWKKRMSPGGDNGRRGLPLPLLGEIVRGSLDAFSIPYSAVETVPIRKREERSERIRSLLWNRLKDFELRGDAVIIAHFDQGAFVRALNIPHISPVGGFDAERGRVVILDVDRDQERPYSVDFDTFCKGLASDYHHVFRPFGYRSGGYVYIGLK
jgi:hypothetical protein